MKIASAYDSPTETEEKKEFDLAVFWYSMTGVGPHPAIVQLYIGELYYNGDKSLKKDINKVHE